MAPTITLITSDQHKLIYRKEPLVTFSHLFDNFIREHPQAEEIHLDLTRDQWYRIYDLYTHLSPVIFTPCLDLDQGRSQMLELVCSAEYLDLKEGFEKDLIKGVEMHLYYHRCFYQEPTLPFLRMFLSGEEDLTTFYYPCTRLGCRQPRNPRKKLCRSCEI
jgi:hypothetical protein